MRLIDADKLIRALKRLAAGAALEGRFEDLGEVSDAIYEVEHQPTAYDIERVVERLRYNAVEIEREDLGFCSYYVPLGKAIEIVKEGAE